MSVVARFVNRGGRMFRDPKGPWILVSAFEHYKRRAKEELEATEKRLMKHHADDMVIAVRRIEEFEEAIDFLGESQAHWKRLAEERDKDNTESARDRLVGDLRALIEILED